MYPPLGGVGKEVMTHLEFTVVGMTCANCAARIERSLQRLAGVKEAAVNLASERARVTYDAAEVTPAGIVAAVKQSGYGVRAAELELVLEGMTCANCAARIERALARREGVLEASVNLASERAHAVYLPEMTSPQSLIKAVESVGYSAQLAGEIAPEDERQRKADELRARRKDVLIAASLSVPLVIFTMLPMLIPALEHALMQSVGMQALAYSGFVLASLVQFGPGRRFYRTGWAALRHGSPDMNTLVMLGTSAAYVYSVVATFLPQILPAGSAHVYYEASATIVTLVLLGKYFEARAKGRTGEAIGKLLDLQPKVAWLERQGTLTEVPVSEVRVDDVLRVRPGDKIPLDGSVLDGASFVDESMLTGEAKPVAKEASSPVFAGSLNTTGSFRMRVNKIGGDTVLAQIIRLVEEAQGGKVPIQALADKVVGVFVPIVLLIAALTFVAWLIWGPAPSLTYALVNAVAVLIIACPCAMGLATPTSIMVGTGKAAELGVLFRKGEALQRLQEVTAVAFDKTGTLTAGKPQVREVALLPGGEISDETTLLQWAAAAEVPSEHPLATAIVKAAEARGCALLETTAFTAVAGKGLSAVVSGRDVLVGSSPYLESQGVATDALKAAAEGWQQRGQSTVFVALDGTLAGALAVADLPKPESQEVLQQLHAQGLKTIMISGDNPKTAQAVAKELGIDEVIAGVLPAGKVDAVRELARTHKVAFVGDGINDAPALAAADVGVAIGSGTDVAIEAADVVLMSGDLRGVARAIALSHAVMRNIKQNLFWAFFYNIILIPVAAGVLYPFFGWLLSPILAAAAMGLSSVFVLSNALRLRRFGVTKGQGRRLRSRLEPHLS